MYCGKWFLIVRTSSMKSLGSSVRFAWCVCNHCRQRKACSKSLLVFLNSDNACSGLSFISSLKIKKLISIYIVTVSLKKKKKPTKHQKVFKQEGLYIAARHLSACPHCPPNKKLSKVGGPQVTIVKSMLSLIFFFLKPLK